MQTLSAEEFKKKYPNSTLTSTKTANSGSSFTQRLKQAATAGIQKIKSSGSDINSGNPLRFAEGALNATAGAVDTVFSPVTAATEPIIKPTIGKAVNYTADKLAGIPSVQKFANSRAGAVTSRVTNDVNNLNTIAGAVVGSKSAVKGGSAASKSVADASTSLIDSIPKIPKINASSKIGKAYSGVKDIANIALDETSRIPDRIATNVAERKAFQQNIKSLPSETARKAAQDGLDVTDIKSLYDIPKSQRAPLKKLADVVQKYSKGETKTNPIEVVGKPIVNRINELEKSRVTIGKNLGEEAKNLGVVTSKETVPAVFGRLQKVPGLEGLELTPKGGLNFKNTVLTTAETANDRKAIQSIYSDAVKWGDGTRKHLLRQELFETLGGKKRSLSNLTATQEKAYQAVRQGLSDVLDKKNPTYKKLSSEYQKVMNPLTEIRKAMRVAGESADVMDMSAGLLARRLTSAAQSNPKIKSILNAMDAATSIPGKSRLSVETMQDFYNILEKYYDIAPKTGFQAQVRQGVEKAALGPLGYVAEQLKDLAGQTPAVRQKALENIFKELFK